MVSSTVFEVNFLSLKAGLFVMYLLLGETPADRKPFVNVNAAIPNPLFLKKSRRVVICLTFQFFPKSGITIIIIAAKVHENFKI
jgi:hypothetical protein